PHPPPAAPRSPRQTGPSRPPPPGRRRCGPGDRSGRIRLHGWRGPYRGECSPGAGTGRYPGGRGKSHLVGTKPGAGLPALLPLHPDGKQLSLEPVPGAHGDAVVAGPAGGAVAVLVAAHAGEEAVDRDVGQAVGADEAADLLRVVGRGDELAPGRGVDAVVAGGPGGRRRDAGVDLRRPGVPHYADDLLGGRAADDRIVD